MMVIGQENCQLAWHQQAKVIKSGPAQGFCMLKYRFSLSLLVSLSHLLIILSVTDTV